MLLRLRNPRVPEGPRGARERGVRTSAAVARVPRRGARGLGAVAAVGTSAERGRQTRGVCRAGPGSAPGSLWVRGGGRQGRCLDARCVTTSPDDALRAPRLVPRRHATESLAGSSVHPASSHGVLPPAIGRAWRSLFRYAWDLARIRGARTGEVRQGPGAWWRRRLGPRRRRLRTRAGGGPPWGWTSIKGRCGVSATGGQSQQRVWACVDRVPRETNEGTSSVRCGPGAVVRPIWCRICRRDVPADRLLRADSESVGPPRYPLVEGAPLPCNCPPLGLLHHITPPTISGIDPRRSEGRRRG